MQISHKVGWEEARERWIAYWQGEIIDRPVMLVTTPRQGGPKVTEPADHLTRWTDIHQQALSMEALNLSRHYLGEAIPNVGGPMAAWCAYYGGPVTYMLDTIWFEPFLDSWDDAPDWERDWDDEGYRHLKEMTEALARSRAGRYFVGFPPTMHTSPSDMLCAMRGVNRYLIDLVEHAEEVQDATVKMSRNFGRIYDDIHSSIHAHGYKGTGNWWPIWCPDRLGVFQSDVCCMLSPAMLESFVIPHLEITASFVDHSFYHLDGPEAIRHVERICEVPGMHSIQWVPGAGTDPGALQWMDLFKRVQAKGKSVYFGLLKEELETVIRELDPRKVILGLGASSAEEADELMAKAKQWTAKYWGRAHM